MNNKIIEALKKPAVYTPSGTAFWDDDYISGQMLKAHLDPDFEGASRKLLFIENQQHGSAILYRHLIIHSFLISAAAPAFMLKDLPGQAIRLLAWIFKTFH